MVPVLSFQISSSIAQQLDNPRAHATGESRRNVEYRGAASVHRGVGVRSRRQESLHDMCTLVLDGSSQSRLAYGKVDLGLSKKQGYDEIIIALYSQNESRLAVMVVSGPAGPAVRMGAGVTTPQA